MTKSPISSAIRAFFVYELERSEKRCRLEKRSYLKGCLDQWLTRSLVCNARRHWRVERTRRPGDGAPAVLTVQSPSDLLRDIANNIRVLASAQQMIKRLVLARTNRFRECIPTTPAVFGEDRDQTSE